MRVACVSVLIAGAIAASVSSGCSPSKWERSFTPVEAMNASLPESVAVKIREVPWERIEAALQELEAERAASDAPQEEWPADKQLAAKEKLLRALQVTAEPSAVEIIGRSAFRTPYGADTAGGELTALARKVGADTVVWASNYLGKTQVVRDEPVNEWRTGSWSTGRDGRRRYDSFSENSTIWVPIVVEADEHAFMAYFLRSTQ